MRSDNKMTKQYEFPILEHCDGYYCSCLPLRTRLQCASSRGKNQLRMRQARNRTKIELKNQSKMSRRIPRGEYDVEMSIELIFLHVFDPMYALILHIRMHIALDILCLWSHTRSQRERVCVMWCINKIAKYTFLHLSTVISWLISFLFIFIRAYIYHYNSSIQVSIHIKRRTHTYWLTVSTLVYQSLPVPVPATATTTTTENEIKTVTK